MNRLRTFGAVAALVVTGIASPAFAGDGAPTKLTIEVVPATCFGVRATHVGTQGDDVILGTEGNDVIVGLAGDDHIVGGGGNDLICSGSGADLVYGDYEQFGGQKGGHDRINAGRGNDEVHGGAGNDRITGRSGFDLIFGGRGADRISGGTGFDQLLGMQGADWVSGGPGDDVIDNTAYDDGSPDHAYGGAGADELWSDDFAGNDLLNGGDQVDQCTANPGDTLINCEL